MQPTPPLRIPIEEIRAMPDGVVELVELPGRRVLVQKSGEEIQLLFDSPESCEIQSRLNLERPFELVSTYTRAMLLGLLWRCPPERVHVMGLGGGRLPMFLRRHFPEAWIECTEIEPAVTELAVRWFGLEIDERLRVVHEDGVGFLGRVPGGRPGQGSGSGGRERGCEVCVGYDLILVDAFNGHGAVEERFAERGFLEFCRCRLAAEGVLAVNLLPGDPALGRRLSAIPGLFRQSYLYECDEAVVVFGWNGPPVLSDELLRRARALQRRDRTALPLAKLARSLAPMVPAVDDPSRSGGSQPVQ